MNVNSQFPHIFTIKSQLALSLYMGDLVVLCNGNYNCTNSHARGGGMHQHLDPLA